MNATTTPAAKPLPADPDRMNDIRAEWARVTLAAFSERTGCAPDEALGDLLCNLIHWADRNAVDFNAKAKSARNVYAEETGAPPPAAPLRCSTDNPAMVALIQAESFVSGFEGDEMQEGIPQLLATIRRAMVAPQERVRVVVNITGGVLQGASASHPLIDVYALDFEERGARSEMIEVDGDEAKLSLEGAAYDPAFCQSVVEAETLADQA